MKNLRVWIDPLDLSSLKTMRDFQYSITMTLSNYPRLSHDICLELVPVRKFPSWFYRIKWTIFPWTAPALYGIKPGERWKPTSYDYAGRVTKEPIFLEKEEMKK